MLGLILPSPECGGGKVFTYFILAGFSLMLIFDAFFKKIN